MRTEQFLQKRDAGWYVRVRVPAQLVGSFGKTHVVQSLQTRDLTEARERRWIVVGEIHAAFRASAGRADWTPARRTRTASSICGTRTVYDRPSMPMVSPHVPSRAEKAYHADGETVQSSVSLPRPATLTLGEAVERWLDEIKDDATRQTIVQHRMAIRRLEGFVGPKINVRRINRAIAGHYITSVLLPSGRKKDTINRLISSCSSLWRWMMRRGLVADNPWTMQGNFSQRRSNVR